MADPAYTLVPLTPVRKVIAARMVEAKQTIPHFHMSADIEIDALVAVRSRLCEQPDGRISLNALIVKACAAALMDAPGVNLQWVDGEIRQYRSADIAVVTALPGGLSTPIVRNAEMKSVREIGAEIKTLAQRAAENALRMDEVFGGTFSISNLGMYDVEAFDAIINPPQCAMLAVGTGRAKLLPEGEGGVRHATVLRATLSLDHRAIDGATAALFMRALKARIEQPDYLCAGVAS